MRKKFTGMVLIVTGLVLMILALVSFLIMGEPVKKMGMEAYLEQGGLLGRFAHILYMAGYEAGLVMFMAGSLIHSLARNIRIFWSVTAGVLVFAGIYLLPLLLGPGHAPDFFMAGGIILFVLTLLLVWFWSRERTLIDLRYRAAADLKMTGYLFLLLATWNVCRLGGMPFFTLYPDKMMIFQTLSGAIIHTKLLLLYFILGWFFVGLGYYKTYMVGKNDQ